MKKTIFGKPRVCSCCEAQTVVNKIRLTAKSKLKSKNAKRMRGKSKVVTEESKAKPKKAKWRNVASCISQESKSAAGNQAHKAFRDVNLCLNPIVLLERLPAITSVDMAPGLSKSCSHGTSISCKSQDEMWRLFPSGSCSHSRHGKVTPLQTAMEARMHSGNTSTRRNVNEGCFAGRNENPGFLQTMHIQDDDTVAECNDIRCSVTIHNLNCYIPCRSEKHHEGIKSSTVLASEQRPSRGVSEIETYDHCLTRNTMSLSGDDCTKRREEGSRTGYSSICSPAFSKFSRSRFSKGMIKCQNKAETHGQHVPGCISDYNHRDLLLKRSGKHEIKEFHQQKFPQVINACKTAVIKNTVLSEDGASDETGSNSCAVHAKRCKREAAGSQEGPTQTSGSSFSLLSEVENPPGSIAAQRAALLAYRRQVRGHPKSLAAVPQSHSAPVHKNKTWKPCKYCPKVVSTDDDKQRAHNMKMHPFQCSMCRWQYASKVELVHHKKECEVSRYISCPICGCRYLKSQQVRHCHSQKHITILHAIRLGAILAKTQGKLDQYILGALCPEGPLCQVCNPFLMPSSAVKEETSSPRNEDMGLVTSLGTHGQQSAQSEFDLMSGDIEFFQDPGEQVGLFTDVIVGTGSEEPCCADANGDSLSGHKEMELSFPALFEDYQLLSINVHEESSTSGYSSPHKVHRNCIIPTASSCSSESVDLVLNPITAARDADFCTDNSSDMMSAVTELPPIDPDLLSGLSDHPTLHPSDEISAMSSGSSCSTDFLSMPISQLFKVDSCLPQSVGDTVPTLDTGQDPFLTVPCCSGEQECSEQQNDAMTLASPGQDSGFGELI